MKVLIRQKKKDPRIKIKEIRDLICKLSEKLEVTDSSERELSIYFTDDDEIRKLNHQYRHQDRATDVLSFAQDYPVLGDIVISIEHVEVQAKRYQVSFQEELYRMIIHGTLHLLDYDHETDPEGEREMMALQDRLLSEFLGEKA